MWDPVGYPGPSAYAPPPGAIHPAAMAADALLKQVVVHLPDVLEKYNLGVEEGVHVAQAVGDALCAVGMPTVCVCVAWCCMCPARVDGSARGTLSIHGILSTTHKHTIITTTPRVMLQQPHPMVNNMVNVLCVESHVMRWWWGVVQVGVLQQRC